ncbi:MAG: histidinol dehydrogenase, partial [cyanobacterium endosymbiont of Rhopalodia inflata]
MVRIIKLAQLTSEELAVLYRRAEVDVDQMLPIAKQVIDAIIQTGDAGVIKYARKFDYSEASVNNIKVTETEFAQARELVEPDIKTAVEQSFRNIKAVHQGQMPEPIHLAEIDKGIFAGEKITPIPRVGLYVPRGRGAFPSIMLMLTIPAMVAGVEKIVVCTTPDKKGKVEPISLLVAEM